MMSFLMGSAGFVLRFSVIIAFLLLSIQIGKFFHFHKNFILLISRKLFFVASASNKFTQTSVHKTKGLKFLINFFGFSLMTQRFIYRGARNKIGALLLQL